jgi:drug/metabolite transporter (DMT)-like permease
MIFSLPFYLITAFLVTSSATNVRMTIKQWLAVIGLGLFGYYLSSLFDFMGLQYVSAGLERLILFLYPTFVVLLNAVVFRQKIGRIQTLALLLTYGGIATAYIGEMNIESANPDFYWGSFLIFICSVTYAVYIAGSGRLIPIVGASKFTAYAMLASTTGIFLHFAIAGDHAQLPQLSQYWTYGLLIAIVATVIPSFMISYAMKKIGSNNVAIISSVGPVSTIIQAHLILNEQLFFAQIVGTVLVIAGVLMIGWKTSEK